VAIAQPLEQRIRDALPRLSPQQVEPLARAVERLVEAFHPDRIYAFGSQTRGTPRPDSDIDLMVVVSTADEPTYRLAAAAYAAVAPLRVPLEIAFMTREDFDSRVLAAASLPATILREGQVPYAA
jgi:predicted nucleotidyltransferase